MIRISEVRLGDTVRALVDEVLMSGHLVQGPMVEKFERRFATICEAEHAIAVSSGTTALVAALQALELGPGDEVITSAFTFAATVNAILESGATAHLVDIRMDDFGIDVDAVEAAITPRTRAIVPVHLYGCPCAIEYIRSLAAAHDLAVVEDAAHAHGARVGDATVGSDGTAIFSFYGTKNVTTGEGGLVVTDDSALAQRLRLLRNQGMKARYEYEIPGHNYRMTDLHAAVGIGQLEHLGEWNDRRRLNARRLGDGLGELDGIVLPGEPPGRFHVYHQFTIRVTSDSPMDRGHLAKALAARGIETGIYYPHPIQHYECYREHARVAATPTPVADQAAREVLSLPVHPWLSESDLDSLVSAVRDMLTR